MSSSRAQSSKSSGSSSSPNEPSQASPAPELSSPVPTDMDQISAPPLSSDAASSDASSSDAPTVLSDVSTPDHAASQADQSDTLASAPDVDKAAAVKPLTPPKPPTRPAVAKPSEDPKPQSVKPSAAEPTVQPDKAADESSAAKATADVANLVRTEATPGATRAGETEKNTPRSHPIPPASEPMQYRAIGLVRGVYAPSEEQFTRGTLTTEDGTVIDAVLLGRVMSLVKKHLDLTQAHLWVVYPRTREKATDLHAQIVGVWEPESLTKSRETDELETGEVSPETRSEPAPEAASETAAARMPDGLTDGYFSVRGEVLSASSEENRVVVRVQQSPKKTGKPGDEKERMFKIILHGTLEGKTVGYFWDLHAQRQGNNLILQSGTLIGLVPPKKRKSKGGGPRNSFARKKRFPDRGGAPSRPVRAGEGGSAPAPVRREGVSKPVKRQKDT